MIEEIKLHHENDSPEVVDAFLRRFEAAPVREKDLMLLELKQRAGPKLLHTTRAQEPAQNVPARAGQALAAVSDRGGWVITVPLAAVMGAMFFFTLRGMMLP